MVLPPINLPVPAGTKAIYITAISLYHEHSEVSVSWSDGSANDRVQFDGPNKTHVLGDKVFHLPIIAIEGNQIPKELVVSVNFKDSIEHQSSIVGPIYTKVGPEGDATQVQISGYAHGDEHHHRHPTTVTILFQGSLPLVTQKK